MRIVNPNSLAVTLDGLNDAFFYGRPLSESQREQAAQWIAGRQGLRAISQKSSRRNIRKSHGEKSSVCETG